MSAREKKVLTYGLDDDAATIELLGARFRKLGHEFLGFTDPSALYAAVSARSPDLVTVDLHLTGEISGFQVIERLRGPSAYVRPIVAISSDQDAGKIAHAIETGANHYLLKGFSAAEFEVRVREALAPDEAPLDPSPSVPVGATLPSAHLSFAIRILEVRPLGFTLHSAHLIKKGMAIRLRGAEIRKIVPSAEALAVTVLGTEVHLGPEAGYRIRVAIDTSNERAAHEIQSYLRKIRGT